MADKSRRCHIRAINYPVVLPNKAADAGYLARIMLGTPHPATSQPERADYASCDQ